MTNNSKWIVFYSHGLSDLLAEMREWIDGNDLPFTILDVFVNYNSDSADWEATIYYAE
jgi:hypothetical protein